MVTGQLQLRGITDARVLEAFLKIPRHEFVPPEFQGEAYADHPIPIGNRQTISQPYMVALMTQWLRLQGHERVLEIGTGSGYQLAVLAQVALEVYSVERVPELAQQAVERLHRHGHLNVHVTTGDGSLGWPDEAPYEGIVVTAGTPKIPDALVEQLAEEGRLVIPVGSAQAQMLTLVHKHAGQLTVKEITSCVFVPLVGEQGWSESGET